ncbi:MAG: hypothetical protein N2510_00940 [Ignavibacteria bacterium]|nr:hypothetical protein [Ignavibacteria bacterium]
MKFKVYLKNSLWFYILFFLSLFIRVLFLVISGFDGLYGQDAYEYLECSERFKNELAELKIPEKFFYWPSGYFIVSSLTSIITFQAMHVTTLGISLISGSLLAPFVYRLSEHLIRNYFAEYGIQKAAVYAGLITVFSGVLIKSSVVIMSDALALTLLVRSVYYLVKYSRKFSLATLLFSVILLSISIMIRYANLLFLPVIFVILGYLFITNDNNKIILKHVLISFIAGTVIFIPELYYISKYGISYFGYQGGPPTWASGWNLLNFFRNEFVSYDGIRHYKLINAIYYLTPVFHPLYIFAFGITFIYGLWKILRLKKILSTLLLVSWIAVYYLYLGGVPFQSLRYTMSFLPALIVLSSIGFSFMRLKPLIKGLVFVFGVILLLGAAINHFIRFNSDKKTELEISSYVRNELPENSNIYSFEITGALKYYTNRNVKEFATTDISEIENKIRSGEKTLFLLPIDEMRIEYRGMDIGNKLELLERNFSFGILNRIGNYTILEASR